MSKIATIGNFDGLHLGHRLLIEKVKDYAKKLNKKPKVYTFDILTKKNSKLLFTLDERIKQLNQLGIEDIEVLEFRNIKDKTPEEFVEKLNRDGVTHLVVGEDFRFGKKASGDINTLKKLGKSNNMRVDIIKDYIFEGTKVSSSKIRELLQNGEMELAATLLAKNFYIKSKVIDGYKRGTKIGYKTANVTWNEDVIHIKKGVYHTIVTYRGKKYNAMTMVGIPYTFTVNEFSVETNIFNFDEEIYGKDVKIEFLEFIRENKKFNSTEELKLQLKKDKEYIVKKTQE